MSLRIYKKVIKTTSRHFDVAKVHNLSDFSMYSLNITFMRFGFLYSYYISRICRFFTVNIGAKLL